MSVRDLPNVGLHNDNSRRAITLMAVEEVFTCAESVIDQNDTAVKR